MSSKRGRGRRLRFGSGNILSLVERNVPLETAAFSGRVVEDKKRVRVASEMKRVNVAAAGLPEIHWFCNGCYVVDGFTLLCSGRSIPYEGDDRRRGEGVAVAWNKFKMDALSAGGCCEL